MSRLQDRIDHLASLWNRSQVEDDANVELDLQLAWSFQRAAERLAEHEQFVKLCGVDVNRTPEFVEERRAHFAWFLGGDKS